MSKINGGLFLRFIFGCWHSLTTLSINFQVFSSVFLSVDRRCETQASEIAPCSLESSDGKIFGCDCTRVPLPLVAIFSLCRCAADCAASASSSQLFSFLLLLLLLVLFSLLLLLVLLVVPVCSSSGDLSTIFPHKLTKRDLSDWVPDPHGFILAPGVCIWGYAFRRRLRFLNPHNIFDFFNEISVWPRPQRQ